MAKIHEELIIIKVSKLYKEGQSAGALIGEDTTANLEEVVQQLVGDDVVVEIIKE